MRRRSGDPRRHGQLREQPGPQEGVLRAGRAGPSPGAAGHQGEAARGAVAPAVGGCGGRGGGSAAGEGSGRELRGERCGERGWKGRVGQARRRGGTPERLRSRELER